MAKHEYTAYSPRHILNLDDLPKVVQADGQVWPIFLTVRNCARLFHVSPVTVLNWVKENDLPAIKAGSRWYISVSDLNDWVRARTTDWSRTVTPDYEYAYDGYDTDEEGTSLITDTATRPVVGDDSDL